jgi:hypothetical protein
MGAYRSHIFQSISLFVISSAYSSFLPHYTTSVTQNKILSR